MTGSRDEAERMASDWMRRSDVHDVLGTAFLSYANRLLAIKKGE